MSVSERNILDDRVRDFSSIVLKTHWLRLALSCESLSAKMMSAGSKTPRNVRLSQSDIRLRAMIRALSKAGNPLYYADFYENFLAALPDEFAMSPRNVISWLDRDEQVFKWVGPGTYGLTEWDVGHSAGDEIATFFRERGEPVSMQEIEDRILERLVVKEPAVLAAIRSGQAQRFVEVEDGRFDLAGRSRPSRPDSLRRGVQ